MTMKSITSMCCLTWAYFLTKPCPGQRILLLFYQTLVLSVIVNFGLMTMK